MTRTIPFLLALAATAAPPAKNVIVFLGDAGGIPTLHAASILGHNQPQALFIQKMPHIGLSETSPTGGWVTDSAAGMTAIVTGQKTKNGVISQDATAERGKKDGVALKTILEYAEERGLSTGVITNMNIADATPAACYAHASDRRMFGEIYAQLLKPKFGDGVEVVIGAGRKAVMEATAKLGIDIEPALRAKGYQVVSSVKDIAPDAKRVAALLDSGDYDLAAVVERTIAILARNKKGYFLMVEWDMHTDKPRAGLERVLAMDKVIAQTVPKVRKDTLVLFTADHSFDIRVRGGGPGRPLFEDPPLTGPNARPNVRVEDGHTGEQVLVAADGPGSERVRGFMVNTDLFGVMMNAYGWKPSR